MEVRITNFEKHEPEALKAALERAACFTSAQVVVIYVEERVPADAPAYRNPGWLEYGINVLFINDRNLYIGMIQRFPGASFEFHS